jgi:xylulose-5-phosphate/fructose-6-phosphate phosphoketolase
MTETEMAPLTGTELDALDAWWRAANYLSVGQIYLLGNPLLAEPLRPEHVKPRLLGHWGTTPGLNLIYAHLNRVIRNQDLNVIYVCGPGHGGPGMVANTYLEGTYSELYPHITEDSAGLAKLFRQFSFPGGIPSHAAPETPGSIHEGGELGYSLAHAYGAAFDNPDLIVACVIGDGESETGPLSASWHSNKFLDPARDGAVLPILHLNGYKIANPTLPARIPAAELESLLRGYGYTVHTVEGDDPKLVHQQLAATLDAAVGEIRASQRRARSEGDLTRPAWPAIVLKTPKGWTGPEVVDGLPVEGTWRAHQVPIAEARTNPEHLAQLESWMRSYRPEELFDSAGTLIPELAELAPEGDRRMSANPHANGGLLLRDLRLPDFRNYAVEVAAPCASMSEPTRVLGAWLRDVIRANPENFRLFGLLREHLPELKVRVVNVVDLMRLEPETEHPHGMSDAEFDALFTTDKPVIFAYHGYPSLIHRLTYQRHGHDNLHVRGYQEEGTTTTPFDMVMLNDLDRFHLVMDVIDRVPGLASAAGHVRQLMADKRITCQAYTRQEGQDAPEITSWRWPY